VLRRGSRSRPRRRIASRSRLQTVFPTNETGFTALSSSSIHWTATHEFRRRVPLAARPLPGRRTRGIDGSGAPPRTRDEPHDRQAHDRPGERRGDEGDDVSDASDDIPDEACHRGAGRHSCMPTDRSVGPWTGPARIGGYRFIGGPRVLVFQNAARDRARGATARLFAWRPNASGDGDQDLRRGETASSWRLRDHRDSHRPSSVAARVRGSQSNRRHVGQHGSSACSNRRNLQRTVSVPPVNRRVAGSNPA